MKKFITVDGNTATSNIACKLSDMAFIYPITPSSPMAENVDSNKTIINCFGNRTEVVEMQSEAGAAGALHGALTSGCLATTFTSSQGLLLMIPNMHKIAGELLPCVINVAARTVATHALSIFGDHSDVMGVRNTGFAMLCSSSVQEAQDMALASYLTTLKARIPFVHFFDGFRTSHEISKIEAITDEQINSLVDFDLVNKFRASGLTSDHPTQRGTAQNDDIYFQNREACNPYYQMLPELLSQTFKDIAKVTGRKYKLFEYIGDKNATNIIIAMGSSTETIEETVNYLNANGSKVGLIKVRLFRPFSAKALLAELPKTAKHIAVLDRTKEAGALGEPLYQDICTALVENGITDRLVIGGRYGLSSKDFNPDQVLAIFQNLALAKPKNHFTVGITDDVTNLSLPIKKHIVTLPAGTIECKFWGLGSDGTVSANKNSIKIIGDNTALYSQAYFEYDSKKSGGVTISHLRFGNSPIKSTYYVENADFIACHNQNYLTKFDCLKGIKKNGVFLINTAYTDAELNQILPANLKSKIANLGVKVFAIDANKIADSIGLGRRINTIMQACFFRLTNLLPWEDVKQKMKDAAKKSYAKKGDAVVLMNYRAIDSADGELRQVVIPKEWKTAKAIARANSTDNTYYNDVIAPILKREGNDLPVSAFSPNGEVPTGTTAYEKRNIAQEIPVWIPENCIQCNMCSAVCPHACLRPYLTESGSSQSKALGSRPALGIAGKDFAIQVSPKDCTGCENCVNICPAKNKALKMVEKTKVISAEEQKYTLVKDIINSQTTFGANTIKGSQFAKPLFEFSGACAGCGETPYIKLLTQLVGDHLVIANATGCSSIYGGSSPTCPYTKNAKGKGPAWSNSLFEDNAEFGYGMYMANKKNEKSLTAIAENIVNNKLVSPALTASLKKWLKGDHSDKIASEIIKQAEEQTDSTAVANANMLLGLKSNLTRKSFWIVGGDGWAYDIGFGGLDHVLSSGENIKVLVLDTEVYSNTGGQASKSTPLGSRAGFASDGKKTQKKDLGAIALNYPNCYVAYVAMGANPNQVNTAFVEAEKHNGPAIIIAYATCINHGINMSKTPELQREAVTSGYWPLYRFNPDAPEGKKLTLDPPFASTSYKEFTDKQSRYFYLTKLYPETEPALIAKAEEYRKTNFNKLKSNFNK